MGNGEDEFGGFGENRRGSISGVLEFMLHGKLTSEQREQAVQMYVDGSTLTKVAKTFGVDHSSIYSLMCTRNIPRRKRRKFNFDEHYFDSIDSEDKAYFLGYLYADGYNNEKRYIVRLGLHPKDIDILIQLSRKIGYAGKIRLETQKNGRSYNILSLHSKALSYACANKGMVQRKSLVLKFPSEDQVPERLMSHFMRGYFDGDGCISITKHGVQVNFVSNVGFVEAANRFIQKNLHIKGSIVKHHITPEIRLLKFFSRSNICKFMEWIYQDATIYLKRKYDKFHQYKSCFENKDDQCLNIASPIPLPANIV